jgi:hypothetical protein
MMKVGKPGRVSIMIAHIHPASTLDTVQDFLFELEHETKYTGSLASADSSGAFSLMRIFKE